MFLNPVIYCYISLCMYAVNSYKFVLFLIRLYWLKFILHVSVYCSYNLLKKQNIIASQYLLYHTIWHSSIIRNVFIKHIHFRCKGKQYVFPIVCHLKQGIKCNIQLFVNGMNLANHIIMLYF